MYIKLCKDSAFFAVRLYLLLVFSIGLFIRLYHLEDIPNGFFCDEAANGYHAYSLLKTGRDLYGNKHPLFFSHHGIGWIEPLYIYLTIFFIKIFGLSIFSVRCLAAIAGSLLILSTYFLTKELLDKRSAFLATVFVCFSPWNFHLSRIAFRAILLPLFTTFGLYCFLKGLKNISYLFYASIILAFSAYTYPIIRLYLPLLLLVIIIIYWRDIFYLIYNKKYILIIIIIFLLLVSPIIYFNVYKDINIRLAYIGTVFSTSAPIKVFIKNYLSHYSFDFLFLNGDKNLRHSIVNYGQILISMAPLILIGIAKSLIMLSQKNYRLLLSLFFIGAIPASITLEAIPHAIRSISLIPYPEILASLGFFVLFDIIKNGLFKKFLIISFFMIFLLNVFFYLSSYFIVYPYISAGAWQYGWKQALNYAKEKAKYYDKIAVTRQENQAYIFILFFIPIDPKLFYETNSFGKYYLIEQIPEIFYKRQKYLKKKNLYILRPWEVKGGIYKKIIYYPDGAIAFKIIE